MATYYGGVHTREDAILLLEACQLDILPKISRRLSRKERKILIEPGAVFIWDEAEAGIQRWTDGRLWGSITVSDSFIIRREMERKVRRTSMVDEKDGGVVDMEIDRRGSDENQIDGGLIDGYRYKANGLVRRSLIISASGRQLHLVTYHDSSYGYSPELRTPTSD
ncbi:gluconate transport inducer 1/Pac2, partial [Rhexocercosporidium sp. MPI-PUGE-AT-0058]